MADASLRYEKDDAMPRLRLDLDKETFETLAEQAYSERRPVPLQAEVILRQGLGLPFPYPSKLNSASAIISREFHD